MRCRHRVQGVAVVGRGKCGQSAVEGEGRVDILFSALVSKVGEVVQRRRRR